MWKLLFCIQIYFTLVCHAANDRSAECRAALQANNTTKSLPEVVGRISFASCTAQDESMSGGIPAKIHTEYSDGPFRCYIAWKRLPTRKCVCLRANCGSNSTRDERDNCRLCRQHGGVYETYEECMGVSERNSQDTAAVTYPEPRFANESMEGKVFYDPSESRLDLAGTIQTLYRDSMAENIGPVDMATDVELVDEESKIKNCPHLQEGLLRWCELGTWSGNEVTNVDAIPSGGTVYLPVGKKILLDACEQTTSSVFTKIVIPDTSELIFPNADIKITVSSILVRGALRIGSNECRLGANIQIVMPPNNEVPNLEYGIIADTGQVDIHGASDYGPLWTRLAKSVQAGDTSLEIKTNIQRWRPGQQILVTTSYFKDEEKNENEILEITGSSGATIQVKTPFEFSHYGGDEYQSEVALMTRNIMIMGTYETESTKIGPQIFLGGQQSHRVRGVMAYRMGQLNVRGAYPFHFHLLGKSPESYFMDNVVFTSYYRCFVVHGTSDAQILRNIAFNVNGHCFYLEDGVEEGNTFGQNLGAYIHPIGAPASGFSQSGETFEQSPGLSQPADAGASAFYISNPNNNLIGNAASGGVSGFSFPVLEKPIGVNRLNPMTPSAQPFGVIEQNTAHSSGYYSLQTGGCMYFGGSLKEVRLSDYQFKLVYNSGRSSFPNRDSPAPTLVNNKVWLCNTGLLFWGEKMNLDRWRSYDSIRSVFLLSISVVRNAYASASSNNANSGFPGNRNDFEPQAGIQLYDTGTQTILDDVTFANFKFLPDLGYYRPACIHSMTHSDQFKPAGMVRMGKITYENSDVEALIRVDKKETGASRMFNFVAIGGSAVQQDTDQIVGSWPDWWKLSSSCIFNSIWEAHSCTKAADEDIARLDIRIPGYTKPRDEALPPTPDNYIGYVSHFGEASTKMTVTINEGITGVTGKNGWYLWLDRGSPTTTEVWITQLPIQKYILLAMPFPSNAQFSIQRIFKWYSSLNSAVNQADSLDKVLQGDGTLYFFDGTYLFIKLVDPQYNNGNLVSGNLIVYGTYYYIYISKHIMI